MLHAVIMAGGSGTRFWPASTETKPKQFLNLFGQQTMLQNTVERISSLISIEQTWVVTNERYVDLTKEQLPQLPEKNIIAEPVGKNTAPCVGAAAALIANEDEEAVMAVLPADHLIKDAKVFRSTLKKAAQKAKETNALGTLGIKPRHPETGYGYIEFDETDSQASAYEVEQFREKPDKATAQAFIEAGNFLWNSGMFIWQTKVIKEAFKKHLPDVFEQIEIVQKEAGTASQQQAINEFYYASPSVSIDYGIMEKAEEVFVIPADFGWNDVGDWNAFYELNEKDETGNAVQTNYSVIEDSENNLVLSSSDKMIALAGVDNMAVIETKDAILVCDLDNAQKVKQAVNKIRDNKELEQYL